MRFIEAYEGWNRGRLAQAEAGDLLGMSERNFRRYLGRYKAGALEGLIDHRLGQLSNRRAPVDEVMTLTESYRRFYVRWNVKHFHAWYQKAGGSRSYTWVKKCLQAADLAPKVRSKGTHRKKRDRSPLPSMMIHQNGSTHEWISGQVWGLIVTMDDVTSEHYSIFLPAKKAHKAV